MDAIERNKITIEPFDIKKLGPVSYDLTTRLERDDEEVIDLVTEETITLSRDIAGIVCFRSNATKRSSPPIAVFSQLVDPGYSGKLIFRIVKLKYPLGDLTSLFQIMFVKVDGKVAVPYNKRKSSTAMNRVGFK